MKLHSEEHFVFLLKNMTVKIFVLIQLIALVFDESIKLLK